MFEPVAEYTHSGFQFLAYVSLICFSVSYLPGISTITRCLLSNNTFLLVKACFTKPAVTASAGTAQVVKRLKTKKLYVEESEERKVAKTKVVKEIISSHNVTSGKDYHLLLKMSKNKERFACVV